jgi:hypothetical protein
MRCHLRVECHHEKEIERIKKSQPAAMATWRGPMAGRTLCLAGNAIWQTNKDQQPTTKGKLNETE